MCGMLAPAKRLARKVVDLPSATLLAVQLLGIIVYPFIDVEPGAGQTAGRAFLGVFGVFVLFMAVRAVRPTDMPNWVAFVLGGPALVLTLLEAFVTDADGVVIASSFLLVAFYFATAYALIRYMFADTRVTTDELWATGATFTVIAWGFAHLFVATQLIWDGSFIAAVEPTEPRTWMELLFLSVTTLTSTGLSDIVPVLPNARSFLLIEQIAGMLYLALVVARLTGLTIQREPADGRPSSRESSDRRA